jgi:hypothetical protein
MEFLIIFLIAISTIIIGALIKNLTEKFKIFNGTTNSVVFGLTGLCIGAGVSLYNEYITKKNDTY